jgi:hypothetical protein
MGDYTNTDASQRTFPFAPVLLEKQEARTLLGERWKHNDFVFASKAQRAHRGSVAQIPLNLTCEPPRVAVGLEQMAAQAVGVAHKVQASVTRSRP